MPTRESGSKEEALMAVEVSL